jgi:hypothetical protein
MTYKPQTIQAWAHATAKYMQDQGHTDRDNPVTVGELADKVGFNRCQWSRVKDQLYALKYHLSQRFGRNGGFYLGEPGEEATAIVADQKNILTRLKSLERHQKAVSAHPHYALILAFASDNLEHDLRNFSQIMGQRSGQLALPAPEAMAG